MASELYWAESGWLPLLPASRVAVFGQGEWSRLFSAVLIHADMLHLLSNSYMLGILTFFVHGHFGTWVFPFYAVLGAALVNLLAVATYRPETLLLGASGLVYLLAGFWLTLFVAIERQRSFGSRLLRALGVGLGILFPTTFEPKTSYRTHAIGVLVGVAMALIYFWLNKRKIRSRESTIEIEDY